MHSLATRKRASSVFLEDNWPPQKRQKQSAKLIVESSIVKKALKRDPVREHTSVTSETIVCDIPVSCSVTNRKTATFPLSYSIRIEFSLVDDETETGRLTLVSPTFQVLPSSSSSVSSSSSSFGGTWMSEMVWPDEAPQPLSSDVLEVGLVGLLVSTDILPFPAVVPPRDWLYLRVRLSKHVTNHHHLQNMHCYGADLFSRPANMIVIESQLEHERDTEIAKSLLAMSQTSIEEEEATEDEIVNVLDRHPEHPETALLNLLSAMDFSTWFVLCIKHRAPEAFLMQQQQQQEQNKFNPCVTAIDDRTGHWQSALWWAIEQCFETLALSLLDRVPVTPHDIELAKTKHLRLVCLELVAPK